jgi:hypothetical protein
MGVSKSLNCLLKFGSFVFVVMFCDFLRQVDLWVFFFFCELSMPLQWTFDQVFMSLCLYGLFIACNCSIELFSSIRKWRFFMVPQCRYCFHSM